MSKQPLAIDQAVVLIGGRGSGPEEGGRDPRRKLIGLTVLERLILTAHQAGVRDFLLAVPDRDAPGGTIPCPEKDERFLQEGLRMKQVPLSGLEDLVRRGRIKERFWVFDADVVFDPAILAEAGQDDPSPLRAVAPGIRVCRREALPRAVEERTPPGPAAPDAQGRFSIRVRSREDRKKAERYVLGTGRRPQDGPIAKYFLRPVALWLTKHLLKLNVTPNTMTAASFAFNLLSVWLIVQGDHRSAVLSTFAFQFASILDHGDGANARMTFRVSKVGSAVDVLGDSVIYFLYFMGLPIGLYRADGRTSWLLLGLILFFSMALYFISVFRMARLSDGGPAPVASGHLFAFARDIEKKASRGFVERVIAAIAYIFRSEFFRAAVLVIIIAGGAKALMGFVLVLFPMKGIYIAGLAEKRIRGRRRAAAR